MASKIQQGYGKKLFDGRTTAEELWARSVNERCLDCGAPGTVRIIVFALATDWALHHPAQADLLRALHGSVPSFPTRYGQAVQWINHVYCAGCAPPREREIARNIPDWAWQDIQRGPSKDVAVSQVPQ